MGAACTERQAKAKAVERQQALQRGDVAPEEEVVRAKPTQEEPEQRRHQQPSAANHRPATVAFGALEVHAGAHGTRT